MRNTIIPTHHLPGKPGSPTRVEHIMPARGPVINDVHRHDFHELFFFAKGTGEHMIDLQQWNISGPCLHMVAPGQVHQLDRSADMEGTVVMFPADAQLGHGHAARLELFAHPGRRSALPMTPTQCAEAGSILRQMEAELERAEGPVLEVVEGYLGILLIKCAHWTRSNADPNAPVVDPNDPIRRFLELLEQGYLSERQVGQYADRMAMTADHLNALVKKRTGNTVSQVINDRVLLEAKRSLLHSDLSIKEVGYALNMKDPAYFSRWFHKAAGMAPAEFRKHIREKYQH